MNIFQFIFYLAIVNIVFGFLWRWVVAVPITLLFVLLKIDRFIYILKGFGYYLLVSLTALLTLNAIHGRSSIFSLIFYPLVGAFILYFAFAQNYNEARQQAAMEHNYELLEDIQYDGLFMIGAIVLYFIILFVPVVGVNPLSQWLFRVIEWAYNLPVIGWIIRVGGGLLLIAVIWQGVIATAVLIGSAVEKIRGVSDEDIEKDYEIIDEEVGDSEIVEAKEQLTEESFMGKIIIECPKIDCKQRLRIPRTTKTIRVTCPYCGNSFVYPGKTFREKRTSMLKNLIRSHPIFFGVVITLWFILFANRFTRGTITGNYLLITTIVCIILWFLGTWIIDKLKKAKSKWYFQRWIVIIMLVVFAPLGITLLWAGAKFKKTTKIILTTIFGLWFVVGVLTNKPESFDYSPKKEIVRLIKSQKENIFLRTASQSTKISFRNEILSGEVSPKGMTQTIPQIVKKWGKSITLIKSIDKDGDVLGQGSSFVISKNGAIVTNYHVVESSYSVSIEFIDGKCYKEVTLIVGYPSMDIAILNIEGEDEQFSPVIMGNSDELQVGEKVLAIGNPYGWENTVSDGLIAGIREVEGYNLLQITTPISPGSSGGALFDMKGEVIGITTIGSQWGAQNLNFAIPINTLKSLIENDLK